MKNFIAGMAVLLLLVIFPLQSTLELVNDQRLARFDEIVYKATQTARVDGYFKQTTVDQLRADLRAAFSDLSDGDIYIDVTTTPKYRTNVFDERELVYYDIRIPVKKLVVAPAILGINESDNQYISCKRGFVLSEVLMPEVLGPLMGGIDVIRKEV